MSLDPHGEAVEPYGPRIGRCAHYCSAVGSTVYCSLIDCPHCEITEQGVESTEGDR